MRKRPLYKLTSWLTLVTFCATTILLGNPGKTSAQTQMSLPPPGIMVTTTPAFNPALLKGLTLQTKNPFQFDFIVDKGERIFSDEQQKVEYQRLIKYFLASLTIPEEDLWVNLSPSEHDRIIAAEFGVTEMGRDMLMQDYILKQLTASLSYPESDLGKKFWDSVYQRAYQQLGETDLPLNTLNKVWIVPEKTVVYENKNVPFVLESHLKVMLEEDHLISSSVGHGTWDELSLPLRGRGRWG